MNRQLSLQTVIFIFLFSFITGQMRYQNEIFDEVLKTENVVYGNAPDLPYIFLFEWNTVDIDLEMDIYQPSQDTITNRPVIIFIHPGGVEGLKFLFFPRFSDLTASSIVLALGHSFFTLSLGMGTMITYGSYLNKNQNLIKSALWVIFLDTFIALLAGVAIFSTVFALKADPAGGPGLIFFVLPSIFPQLAYGTIWSTLFFSLLFMAALTSAISILEVVTAYMIDQKGWSRKKATLVFGSLITIVGVFCSLSMGGGINLTSFMDKTFFDFMDELSSKYMLPVGGFLTAIFVLKEWSVKSFISELGHKIIGPKEDLLMFKIFFLISAFLIGFILFNEIILEITGKAIVG
ncbi:sodium-dependent transporter [Candidatus Marinimicrobia bacterium]|nr:sodium-dependent transporter [Candidatus Neomarinimicrobiota bacterium]